MVIMRLLFGDPKAQWPAPPKNDERKAREFEALADRAIKRRRFDIARLCSIQATRIRAAMPKPQPVLDPRNWPFEQRHNVEPIDVLGEFAGSIAVLLAFFLLVEWITRNFL